MVAVSYVEEAPVAEILPNKVRITVKSGDDVCIRVMERSVWRRFLETGIRQLDAYERAESAQRKVVKIGEPGHS